jgi:hypothetical protein
LLSVLIGVVSILGAEILRALRADPHAQSFVDGRSPR